MKRDIKSFVLRAGRVSPRQRHALDHLLVNFTLPMQLMPWCFAEVFGREADTVVEIGFGMGASLLTMAKARPEVNFIGVEVHRAGLGSLSAELHDGGVTNVRIAPFDACDVFRTCLPDASLAGIQLFFPDPWPKKRHHKRRLIQSDFVKILVQKMKAGGFIHCATDWQEYAEQMKSIFSKSPFLINNVPDGGFSDRPDTRPLTKFEHRGHRLGHGVWDLIFLRT